MKWTEDKLDILQNLEFAIVQTWRRHPEMTDHVAHRAYETAFDLYRGEMRGGRSRPQNLTGVDIDAFEALKAMCEFRLGRGPGPVPGVEKIRGIPIELLVECLRELRKVRRTPHQNERKTGVSDLRRTFPAMKLMAR
jgi:hypothetical protein